MTVRRGLHRNDDGQALAIGVFLLVLLAIGVYMIATFGKHVKEKQHVQTTADALALSLATMEAQSFNYIAFANRAQAAHYVTILNLQGYVSLASSMEHAALVTSALLHDAVWACRATAAIPPVGVEKCPVHSSVLDQWSKDVFQLYKKFSPMVKTLDDMLGARLTKHFENLNKALWVTELIMAGIVDTHLLAGGREVFHAITRDNDPNWSATTAGLVMNELFAYRNHQRYKAAFDGIGGGPFAGSKMNPAIYDNPNDPSYKDAQRAQRIMTEIVNATRYDRSLTSRTLPYAGETGLSVIINVLRGIVDKVPAMQKLLGRFGGESKLIGEEPGSSLAIDEIFSAQPNSSKLSTGRFAASSDEWLWGRGSIWVKAADGGSKFRHCRGKQDVSSKPLNPFSQDECITDSTKDPNHEWKGISPFMLYNAGREKHEGATGEHFHQPDVLVWLHKSAEQVQFKKTVAFTWKTKGQSASIDTEIGRAAEGVEGLGIPAAAANELKGVHAFARAQAYYHRPGNWEEPPNLFNPFWRARLAPIVDAREPTSEDFLDHLGEFAAGNVIFH